MANSSTAQSGEEKTESLDAESNCLSLSFPFPVGAVRPEPDTAAA